MFPVAQLSTASALGNREHEDEHAAPTTRTRMNTRTLTNTNTPV